MSTLSGQKIEAGMPAQRGSFSAGRIGRKIGSVLLRIVAGLLVALLFLAGGPAGSELAWTRGYWGELEKHFMVNTVLAQTQPPATTSPPTAGPTDAREVQTFFDELLPRQLREHHMAGAAVAVVKDGRLLFAKGYGFSDLETRQPVIAERTLFRTDSTGKLFVWTAVMQLVEQGKLDLDADVNRYLDFEIPATFAQPITLRHLLSHSAGFEDQGYLFAHSETDLEAPGAFLARHIPARVRPPGEVSGYSNYGTALAGYIVERVAGMRFEAYVESRIFQPLGMERSTFRQPLPAALDADLTTNYRYVDGRFNALPFQFLRVPPAGEGHMTVTDMARFMIAHLEENNTAILSADTARQMHGRLFAHDPEVNGFAYGFAETTLNNQRLLRHEGNNPGMSSTALFLIPEENVGVYVAYNSNGGTAPGDQLRSAFLDRHYPAPPAPVTPIQLSPAQINQLKGSYRSTRMFHTTFAKIVRLLGGNYADVAVNTNEDGTFTVEGIGQSPLQWVAVEPLVLRLADGALDSYGDLRFQADDQGRITTLFVENNPYRAYEKVAWYEAVPLQTLLLAACMLIFLSVLVAWPVTWFVQRQWPAVDAVGMNRPAWILLGIACILGLLFPAGLLLVAEESLLYSVTAGLVAVLSLPLIALALFGVSVFVTAFSWGDSQWGVISLVHYGAASVAMIVFVWWLHYWNLLGWRF
ncbi:MAG TPA: serine hydrolase domain-containing protein [Anaerolineae bacterium]